MSTRRSLRQFRYRIIDDLHREQQAGQLLKFESTKVPGSPKDWPTWPLKKTAPVNEEVPRRTSLVLGGSGWAAACPYHGKPHQFGAGIFGRFYEPRCLKRLKGALQARGWQTINRRTLTMAHLGFRLQPTRRLTLRGSAFGSHEGGAATRTCGVSSCSSPRTLRPWPRDGLAVGRGSSQVGSQPNIFSDGSVSQPNASEHQMSSLSGFCTVCHFCGCASRTHIGNVLL